MMLLPSTSVPALTLLWLPLFDCCLIIINAIDDIVVIIISFMFFDLQNALAFGWYSY